MFRLYQLLRVLLFPIIRYLLPLFSQKMRQRIDFEQKNLVNLPAIKSAEYGFEISSEGELEQVQTLLNVLLEGGEKIELVFCSPSVEKQCEKLLSLYPNQIRLYRYPLICYNPFSSKLNPAKWLTCKTLFLCRYDFFPELIHLGAKKECMILLAANLDTFNSKNFLVKSYLKYCYQSFNKIITSTESSKSVLDKTLSFDSNKIRVHDFRVSQILKRQENADEKFHDVLKENFVLVDYIKSLSTDKKVIMGSFWNNEIALVNENLKDRDLNLFIFPHKLDEKNINELEELIKKRQIDSFVVSEKTTKEDLSSMIGESQKVKTLKLWIIVYKGILCEAYKLFDYCYVGGGFGESIHSVLEPYLAGNTISCGPKVYRSSEFSYIKSVEPNAINKFAQMSDILDNLLKNKPRSESITRNTNDTEIFGFLDIKVEDA